MQLTITYKTGIHLYDMDAISGYELMKWYEHNEPYIVKLHIVTEIK